MNVTRTFLSALGAAALICFSSAPNVDSRASQSTQQKSTEKSSEKSQEKSEEKKAPQIPAQIELLETRVRFETNGDSRKEVHALVKINDELGVRQFARLNFDFNRAFEQIEIPLVRITHPSGGTADVLPSAITDTPNPAVSNAPAYQDVRIKSVRILGLEPGDSLEYRVITTTSHHPLSPDFWFEHTFDRTGVVSHEIFELEFPASLAPETQTTDSGPPQSVPGTRDRPNRARVRLSPGTPAPTIQTTNPGESPRVLYSWSATALPHPAENPEPQSTQPDIAVSSFASWQSLGSSIVPHFLYGGPDYNALAKKFYELERSAPDKSPYEAIYNFVSKKIRSVDLPLGATGFHLRTPMETLTSGYGTPEDKIFLLAALARPNFGRGYYLLLLGDTRLSPTDLPSPALFAHVIIQIPDQGHTYYLDPSLEVAPFGVLPAGLRGKMAFTLQELPLTEEDKWWSRIPETLPFPSSQHVKVDGSLAASGALDAKVRYGMRGDNELLLREAFHQSPKEKWNEVAQLLALSDGFRGKISNATASDPYETQEPFTVSYEVSQPKFLDWSKKPIRMPAILPLLGLPDPPAKTAPGASPAPIDLGTPLDVEVSATIHLPAGTTAHIPTGTSVQRDFATYTSSYSAKDATLTATRHLNFILKEIPADRAADYNAFLRAVQNDESQFFTLERADAPAAKPQTP